MPSPMTATIRSWSPSARRRVSVKKITGINKIPLGEKITPAITVQPARRSKKYPHTHSKVAGTQNAGGSYVSQQKPKTSLVPAPTVPAYGQTLFGGGTSTEAAYTPSPYALAQIERVTKAREEAARHLAKDSKVWQGLEQHILQAITETSRVGKPFNSKIRLNTKVREAIDILKPIVLGAEQAPSDLDLDVAQPATTTGSTAVPVAGVAGITAGAAGVRAAPAGARAAVVGARAGAAGLTSGAAGMTTGAARINTGAAGVRATPAGARPAAAGMTTGAAGTTVSLPGKLAQLQPPRLEWNEATGMWQWVIQ